jgi:hypothetical protein
VTLSNLALRGIGDWSQARCPADEKLLVENQKEGQFRILHLAGSRQGGTFVPITYATIRKKDGVGPALAHETEGQSGGPFGTPVLSPVTGQVGTCTSLRVQLRLGRLKLFIPWLRLRSASCRSIRSFSLQFERS